MEQKEYRCPKCGKRISELYISATEYSITIVYKRGRKEKMFN